MGSGDTVISVLSSIRRRRFVTVSVCVCFSDFDPFGQASRRKKRVALTEREEG